MNPPDNDILAMLHRLAPAPLSDGLMDRLRSARPSPRPSPRPSLIRFGLPLAAAASLTLALLLPEKARPTAPPVVAEQDLRPVGSVQHLMKVTDLGVVINENDQAVRLICTSWVDEITYAPAGGGQPVTQRRLREDILPVSLNLF